MRNVEQAIDLHVESLTENGEPVPIPLSEQEFSGKLNLHLGRDLHRDIAAAAGNKSIYELLAEAAEQAVMNNSAARANALTNRVIKGKRARSKRKAG